MKNDMKRIPTGARRAGDGGSRRGSARPPAAGRTARLACAAAIACAAASSMAVAGSERTSSSALPAGESAQPAPDAGWRFSARTLSGALECPPGTEPGACGPPLPAAARAAADASAAAASAATTRSLTLATGPGGFFAFNVSDTGWRDVFPRTFAAATLTVTVAAPGSLVFWSIPRPGLYSAVGWQWSDGLDCDEFSARRVLVCALRADAGGDAAPLDVSAFFEPIERALTVVSGPGGSVLVSPASGPAATVAAGSRRAFAASVEAAPELEARPEPGWRFAGWALSGPAPFRADPAFGRDPACHAAADPACRPRHAPHAGLSADATVTAAFEAVAWTGPGAVSADGSTLTAVPYLPNAFAGWRGAPCDGSAELECDASLAASTPVAAFRPFVPAGIKSLAFGLGYQGGAPDHFRVSVRDAPDAGFLPVPGLERLAPGLGPARLPVSAHLLAWGVADYLTEACDAANACVAASGGRQTLGQADSVSVTGYFKAPDARRHDSFGNQGAVALSADGATLAVGAPGEDSAATGVFAPSDPGWRAALRSFQALNSGVVYLYRRSATGRWAVEAYVKAPNAGFRDEFGHALALSDDGATLAVGARFEASSAIGAFAPSDPGWQAALGSNGTERSGAAYVYRRSDAGRWSVEAFVKAPNTDFSDEFGSSVALSGDGDTLAVGAKAEDGGSRRPFVPSDPGWQAALARRGTGINGAAYVYRRSEAARWSVEAYVKPPNPGSLYYFANTGIALSFDGDALAVGASQAPGSVGGSFVPTDAGYMAAVNDNGTAASGAVYTYSRSESGLWTLEAYVKAPNPGGSDRFGSTVALSADGGAMVVGAPDEDSAAAGAFAPSGPGWQAALDSNGASNSGVAYAYRRSEAGRWTLEAYVKAPNPSAGDRFGARVALSGDGVHLAVGSSLEDSASAGVLSPDAPGYQAALDSNGTSASGAAYAYRRSEIGRWTVGSFVKAPNPGADDRFGSAVALSADGGTLAVGAPEEDGAARGTPIPFRASGATSTGSGAVYLY